MKIISRKSKPHRRRLNRGRVILSQNDDFIPKRLSYSEEIILSRITSVTQDEKKNDEGGEIREDKER